MKNPEDEGRFLKSLLRGVPTGYGLTRNEQILQTLTSGLSSIRDRLPTHALQRQETQAVAPYVHSAPQQIVPQQTFVNVEVPLDELARAQNVTNDGIARLVDQGAESLGLQQSSVELNRNLVSEAQMQSFYAKYAEQQRRKLVRQGRLSVMLLESLDESGRQAYIQRMALIGGLHQTRDAISILDEHIDGGFARTSEQLSGIREQGQVSIAELRRHTGLLDEIAQLEGSSLDEQRTQTGYIADIGEGVRGLVAAAYEAIGLSRDQNEHLAGIRSELQVSNAIAANAAQYLQRIGDTLNVLVFTGQQTRRAIERAVHVLENPIKTRAQEQWSIGEQCRKVGDSVEAFRMFDQSRTENPAEARNYYSMAMLCLEVGAVSAARDFFTVGFNYARQNQDLSAHFLLQMGKLANVIESYGEAKILLEASLARNRKDISTWYELAFTEMKLNNTQMAVYYLRNLLAVARHVKAPPEYKIYIQKIVSEPVFTSIISQISQ